jgi:hypothetical protein
MECIDFHDVIRRSDELVKEATESLLKMERRTYDVVTLRSAVETGSVRRRAARQFNLL